jgi:hypothetical protein
MLLYAFTVDLSRTRIAKVKSQFLEAMTQCCLAFDVCGQDVAVPVEHVQVCFAKHPTPIVADRVRRRRQRKARLAGVFVEENNAKRHDAVGVGSGAGGAVPAGLGTDRAYAERTRSQQIGIDR